MRLRRNSDGAAQGNAAARRHRPDYQIILFSGILLLVGLIVLYSISPAYAVSVNSNGYDLNLIYFMQKQSLYLGIGFGAFIAASLVPLWVWEKWAGKIMITGLLLCLGLVLFALLGVPLAVNPGGAYRWYDLGFITFQPAEALKFGILIFTAVFLGRRIKQGNVNDQQATLIPIVVLVGISMFFVIVAQKDMGTGITLIGIVATMLLMAGLNVKYMAYGVAGLIATVVLLIAMAPHRIERVTTFINPSAADPADIYHILQVQMAIGNGGLTGKGLGQSVSAFGYVPEALNDSIFAILGETFGFIGLVAIMAVFFMLLLRLLKVMDHITDPTHRMIVAGVFGWIGTHTVVNIGAMLGVFPLTGVTLPFVSFGGTSLLFIMMALGIVFHISRYTSHTAADQVNKKGESDANSRGRRGVGRARYASPRSY